MYYDVIVIGAGPAGMSAAIRARRPKTFDYLPSDVLVIEEGESGAYPPGRRPISQARAGLTGGTS